MDNLSLGIARLGQKSGKRAGTVVPRHSTSGGGRFPSEWVADLARNRWPIYFGISGRLASEYAVPLSRAKHIRGWHPVKPGHNSIEFESLLEKQVITSFAALECMDWIVSQPVTVSYSIAGTRHRYTPDFLLNLYSVPRSLRALGFCESVLIEVKPEDRVPREHDRLIRHHRAIQQALDIPIGIVTDAHLALGTLGGCDDR